MRPDGLEGVRDEDLAGAIRTRGGLTEHKSVDDGDRVVVAGPVGEENFVVRRFDDVFDKSSQLEEVILGGDAGDGAQS